jgi:hypothetical protein
MKPTPEFWELAGKALIILAAMSPLITYNIFAG